MLLIVFVSLTPTARHSVFFSSFFFLYFSHPNVYIFIIFLIFRRLCHRSICVYRYVYDVSLCIQYQERSKLCVWVELWRTTSSELFHSFILFYIVAVSLFIFTHIFSVILFICRIVDQHFIQSMENHIAHLTRFICCGCSAQVQLCEHSIQAHRKNDTNYLQACVLSLF